MARLGGWVLALAFGLFTLFRVTEAWIRPHQATALFVTTSFTLVIIGCTLTTLGVRALRRRLHK
jgi:hypothetical protein